MIQKALTRLGLLVCVLVATVLLAECAVRVTGLSDRSLTDNLYYTGYDREVHRLSDTPGVFYELAPGTALEGQQGYDEHSPVPADLAPGDLDDARSRRYAVSISEHGTRGPTYPEPKGKGVFRVHFFGGSTLYGAGMNNDETIAAYLEEALREQLQPETRVEVWNYGTSAYVLTQMGLLAQRELADHDPDLILILHTNHGRRAFLSDIGADYYRQQLREIPYLLRENFLPGCRDWDWDWTAPMAWSQLYQSLALAIMRDEITYCPPRSEETQFTLLPDLVGEAERLGVGIQFIAAPGHPPHSRESVYPDLPDSLFWSLQLMDREEVFYDAHPSPRILKEHGVRLAQELARRGLVPVGETKGAQPSGDEQQSD